MLVSMKSANWGGGSVVRVRVAEPLLWCFTYMQAEFLCVG